jgi:hypothetical protein
MPDFDRLHVLARNLASLTAPGQQETGLASWSMFVAEDWKEIARMWEEDPKRAAAEDLYAALSFADIVLEFALSKSDKWPPKLVEAYRQSHAKARAALAKARGEAA